MACFLHETTRRPGSYSMMTTWKVSTALALALTPLPARAACDDLVGMILTKRLTPALDSSGCPLPGLDKGKHKLNRVCYESAGATSHVTVDTTLTCQASGESVPAKLLGGKNTPSKSENVTVEADARGADCSLIDVKVEPSGELAKVASWLFGADGKARSALQQGLDDVCRK